MQSIRAIYDGKNILFLENFNIDKPQEIIVTFLDKFDIDLSKLKSHKKKVKIKEYDISAEEIHQLLESSTSYNFLNDEREDIYTDDDLRKKY